MPLNGEQGSDLIYVNSYFKLYVLLSGSPLGQRYYRRQLAHKMLSSGASPILEW